METMTENKPAETGTTGLGTDSLLRVYDRDLTLVSGKGAHVVDADGKSYLDFAAGIGVSGLGHCDPKVVAAIRKQAGQLMHTSNAFHSQPGTRLAERLVELSFPSKVFFTNSGTESVEGALKFARRVGKDAGRFEFLAFERGFSGRTFGALSLTWSPKYREPFEPLLPGVRFLPWNDLAAASQAIGPKTAAVLIEPVQGEGGIRPAPPEFLRGLRELTQERGVLLICDEVQCGLGRTGRMFAYEHAGITPDILTLAKPLGGGLPMGAVLLRNEYASLLKVGEHGSTFGGNPVAAAAANAVLDRLTSPGFIESVARRGATLMRGLKALKRKYPESIVEVRGLGLMLGVQLRGEAKPVIKGLRERGVLANKAGEDVLRLLPPLVVKPSEIRTLLETLDATLASL
jgi:acetylornithine/N-succinyldiaminopimelate aminotransferase